MKILYVVGCTHVGSTLLGRILNQHSRVFTAGELQYLDVYWGPTSRRCSCGTHALRCRVWRAVFERMLAAELRRPRLGRVSAERPAEWMRALAGGRAARTFALHNRGLFAAIAAETGRDVIVDTSKSIWRLLPLWRDPGIPTYALHLVRAPENQIASRMERSGRGFWRAAIGEYGRVNLNARILFGGSDRYRRVRWEDVVERPEDTIRAITGWLGLDDEDLFGRLPAEAHDLGGNPRVKHGAASLRPDPARNGSTRPFGRVETRALGALRSLCYGATGNGFEPTDGGDGPIGDGDEATGGRRS